MISSFTRNYDGVMDLTPQVLGSRLVGYCTISTEPLTTTKKAS